MRNSVYIDGGTILRRFFAVDLVDTLALARVAWLLGSGISLFGDLEKGIFLQQSVTKSATVSPVICYDAVAGK
ncbi:MAG: dihydrofolate reductase [Verrucomicrobiales bacterium]|jgi:dihydrofolate reductase